MTGRKKTTASSAAGASKKARTTRKAAKAVLENEEKATLTVSVEKDALECDICCLPFEYAIFMCKNGHSGCAKCCLRAKGKCWSCRERIGDIHVVRYPAMLSHEETCRHVPYHCPIDGCTDIGLRLYHHVAQDHGSDGLVSNGFLCGTAVTVHMDEPFRVLLHRAWGRVFVLLNGRDQLQGRSLSLLCLGQRLVGGLEMWYRMLLVSGGAQGALPASGIIPFARRLEGFQGKVFFFVPDGCWGSTGTVSVEVNFLRRPRRPCGQ